MKTADPHYWLGYLSTAIGVAIMRKETKSLSPVLSEFLRSRAATPALRERVKEEMKR